jgi:hypothetical protein
MTLGQLLVLYLLAGGAVAVAFYVTTAAGSAAERLLQFAAALAFWPLYLTLLLSRSAAMTGERSITELPRDELERALADVESSVQSLDDWEDGVSARDTSRLDELRASVARLAAAVASRSASQSRIDARVQLQGPSPRNHR